MKKIIVLCDGTWCGRETGTVTNIAILAGMIGLDMSMITAPENPFRDSKPSTADKITLMHPDYPTLIDPQRNLVARYFDGCGHGGNFLSYLWNGATGSDIGHECTIVYRFIVDNWDSEQDCEVWMFGHSRGSFTVRCVAGMINNCGIIKRRDTPLRTETMCDFVYHTYRSHFADDAPSGVRMKEFREKASWRVTKADGTSTRSPIKFMGLIDTVGSLGIPDISPGVGLDYPKFYDQEISSEVEKVYHAQAIHDRLEYFAPCRALRPHTASLAADRPELEIHEKWFPGCHYDVGRQNFRFLRKGQDVFEKLWFGLPAMLTKPVIPNPVLADLVLLWFLEAVEKEDKHGTVLKSIGSVIAVMKHRLASTYSTYGSGDVYASTWDYTPAGWIGTAVHWGGMAVTKSLDLVSPTLRLGTQLRDASAISSIVKYLLATRDRRIPDKDAEVTHLRQPDALFGGRSIDEAAKISGRYGSRTYDAWLEYLYAVGRIDRGEFLTKMTSPWIEAMARKHRLGDVNRILGELRKGPSGWLAADTDSLEEYDLDEA